MTKRMNVTSLGLFGAALLAVVGCHGDDGGAVTGSESELTSAATDIDDVVATDESVRAEAEACFDAFRKCTDGAETCRETLKSCLPNSAPAFGTCEAGEGTGDEPGEGISDEDLDAVAEAIRTGGPTVVGAERIAHVRPDADSGKQGPAVVGADRIGQVRPDADFGKQGPGVVGAERIGQVRPDGDVGEGTPGVVSADRIRRVSPDAGIALGHGKNGPGKRAPGKPGGCGRPAVPPERLAACTVASDGNLRSGMDPVQTGRAHRECVQKAFGERLEGLCERAEKLCEAEGAEEAICTKVAESCAAHS